MAKTPEACLELLAPLSVPPERGRGRREYSRCRATPLGRIFAATAGIVCALGCTGADTNGRPPGVSDAGGPDARMDTGLPDAGLSDAVADASNADAAGAPDVLQLVDAGGPDTGLPEDAGVECWRHEDCLGYRRCEQHQCVDPGDSNLAGALILNEILIDGTVDEDANGDGDIIGNEDEFIEIVNVGQTTIDLAGFLIVETDHLAIPRHTFTSTLPPGQAIVVFGGGSPSSDLEATPGVQFVVANAQDPAFSNGLNLDDTGDDLRLLDPERRVVFSFAYGDGCGAGTCWPAASDRSLTRAPDLTGDFTPHDETPGANAAVFSPGTRADGTHFSP